jgi:hypothetical protein
MLVLSIRRKAWSHILQLVALPILGLSFPAAHAEAVPGFGTTFAPETWVVVNTNPNQTLTNSINSFPASCVGVGINPGTNTSGCVAADTINSQLNDSVTLLGIEGETGNSSSTLQFKNTNWRPLLISFTWSFFDPADESLKPAGGQYIGILVDPGWTSPNDLPNNDYSFTSNPAGDYTNDNLQNVYLPAGATLSFSIYTDNSALAGAFSLKGFTTTEVPAPLPITGSSAVLLYSRRLRRRTLTAASQPPVLHPSTGKVMSLAEQRSRHQHQRALNHYGSLLGGPVVSGLPTPSVCREIANSISSGNG